MSAEIEDVMDDVEVTPELDNIFQDLKFEAPALEGNLFSDNIESALSFDFEPEIPDLGLNQELLNQHLHGDIKIDIGEPVADTFDPDKFTSALLKKGAEGNADKGLLEGFTTLEDMKELDGNALENAKALIGSDLLFEFGKAELKSSAKDSLMLNGHTDLFGSEAANKLLSRERALAVKEWLVQSVGVDADRMVVVAHGMSRPIVTEGDRDIQAINRRVVIALKSKKPSVAPLEFYDLSWSTMIIK